MKIVSILAFCFILVSAKPYDYEHLERRVLLEERRPIVPILRFISSSDNYGTYSYEHSSADGTSMQESGHLKNVNNQLSSVKTGSYEWTSPEGERFHVDYTADELGFRPVLTRLGQSPVLSAPVLPAFRQEIFRDNSYEQPAIVRLQAPLIQVQEPTPIIRVPSYSEPKIFSPARFPVSLARFPTSVRFDSPVVSVPAPLPIVEEAPVSRVPLLPTFLPSSNQNAKELINFAVPEKSAIRFRNSFVRGPSYGYAPEPVPVPETTTLPPPPPPTTTEAHMYQQQPSTDGPVNPPAASATAGLSEQTETGSGFPILSNFDKKSRMNHSNMNMKQMDMSMRPMPMKQMGMRQMKQMSGMEGMRPMKPMRPVVNEMKNQEQQLARGDFETPEFSIRSSDPNNVVVRIGQH